MPLPNLKDRLLTSTSFVCYDDLDPDAYEGSVIAFRAVDRAAPWDLCERRGFRVLADVHTYPGTPSSDAYD